MTSPPPDRHTRLVLAAQITRPPRAGLTASLLAHAGALLLVFSLLRAPHSLPNPVVLPVEILPAPVSAVVPLVVAQPESGPEPAPEVELERPVPITEPTATEIAPAQSVPAPVELPPNAEPPPPAPLPVPAPIIAPASKPTLPPPPKRPTSPPQRQVVPPMPAARPVEPARGVDTPSQLQPVAPPRASDGWRKSLAAWLAARKTYPDAARRAGAEGAAVLRFTVDRQGQVLDVVLVRSTGSAALDDAALAMLRHASLPGFDHDMPQDRMTVTVQVHYSLTE